MLVKDPQLWSAIRTQAVEWYLLTLYGFVSLLVNDGNQITWGVAIDAH